MLRSVALGRLWPDPALHGQLATVHVRPVFADWDKCLREPAPKLRLIAINDLRLWHWWRSWVWMKHTHHVFKCVRLYRFDSVFPVWRICSNYLAACAFALKLLWRVGILILLARNQVRLLLKVCPTLFYRCCLLIGVCASRGSFRWSWCKRLYLSSLCFHSKIV